MCMVVHYFEMLVKSQNAKKIVGKAAAVRVSVSLYRGEAVSFCIFGLLLFFACAKLWA